MANEIQVRSSLAVRKVSGVVTLVDYQARPAGFNADLDGNYGPVQASLAVSLSGTDVSFSALGSSQPGFYRIMNQDATNFVTLGTYDPTSDVFTPVMEIGPGETYVGKWSRFVAWETTGTGTAGGHDNTIRLVANGAPCQVLVETFPK